MDSMTVRHRTLSDQHGRSQLPLPSIPLAMMMLAVLTVSSCSKDPAVSTQDETENKAADKAAGAAELPKMGGQQHLHRNMIACVRLSATVGTHSP